MVHLKTHQETFKILFFYKVFMKKKSITFCFNMNSTLVWTFKQQCYPELFNDAPYM